MSTAMVAWMCLWETATPTVATSPGAARPSSSRARTARCCSRCSAWPSAGPAGFSATDALAASQLRARIDASLEGQLAAGHVLGRLLIGFVVLVLVIRVDVVRRLLLERIQIRHD